MTIFPPHILHFEGGIPQNAVTSFSLAASSLKVYFFLMLEFSLIEKIPGATMLFSLTVL